MTMEEAKMLQSQHIINIWIELQCKMLGLECGPSCQKKMLQNFGFAIEIKMLTKHKQSKCFHLV
jgi:hypothetical protein